MIKKFKIYLIIATLSTTFFSCTEKDNIPPITTVVAPADKVWAYESTPVFEDNFTVNGNPDPAKWGYDFGTGSSGWGNNELQYYTNRPENAAVFNGILKINAIKENYSGSAYTSARLISKNKFSFKYGKIDVRAKFPAGVGTWPAIWMLGSNISAVSWPACGEIDIAEHRGSELNKIFGTLHYPGRSGGNADGKTLIIPNATTDFHNYIVEWTPNYIKIYVDTQLYHTFVNNSFVPFNQNFFIILNVAMGGSFGGAVDPAFTNASMEIDYVKVYKIIP
jgi:beta-glucanase (GH16 family)